MHSTTLRTALAVLIGLVVAAAGLTLWSLQRNRGEPPPLTVPTPAENIPTAAPTVIQTAPATESADESAPSLDPAVDGETVDVEPTLEVNATVATDDNEAALPAAAEAPSALQKADLRFIELVDDEVDTLNPILTRTDAGRSAARKLFPQLIVQDPQSGLLTTEGLAAAWTTAEGSDAITVTLRSDVVWRDGTPITAADVVFTLEAIRSPAVASPYRSTLDLVDTVTAVDERTVVISLMRGDCRAGYALRLPVLPAHRYETDFSDLATSPLNDAPAVTAGPFHFVERTAAGGVVLGADGRFHRGAPAIQTYAIEPMVAVSTADAVANPDGWLLPETSAAPPALVDAGNLMRTAFPDDDYSFIALNLADPARPAAGLTAGGERQPQAPHPILGDLRVRQAIAAGIDADAILSALYGDVRYRTGSYVPPTASWVHDDSLLPYAYAPERAAALLEAAGWQDDDGDGVRSRAGAPLALTLLSNNDSAERMRIAELAAAQLRALGFAVRLEALPFEAMTTRVLLQEYDLAVLGWENVGAEPGLMPFWETREDVPGRGFNFVSFHDPEVDRLLDEARTLPGCDPAARAQRYRQVQQRIHDAAPYIILGGPQTTWLHSSGWAGIEPGPWSVDHNVEAWRPAQ